MIKQKLLVGVLILLTFIGQAIASASVPCHDMNNMKMTNTQMISMSHASMSDEMNSNDNMSSLDCCQQDCNCPVGISASITLSTSLSIDSLVISEQKIEHYPHLLLAQSLTSLYRPPIS